MQKLLQIIRVFTIACYFLPFTFLFVTCSGNNSKELFDFAYNKKEAAENEIKDKDNSVEYATNSTAADTVSATMTTTDSSAVTKDITNNIDTTDRTVVNPNFYFLRIIF